jgi:hypothetical protein
MTAASDHFPTETEGLPEARSPEVIELADGDEFDLRIAPVAERLGAATESSSPTSSGRTPCSSRPAQTVDVLLDVTNPPRGFCGRRQRLSSWWQLPTGARDGRAGVWRELAGSRAGALKRALTLGWPGASAGSSGARQRRWVLQRRLCRTLALSRA